MTGSGEVENARDELSADDVWWAEREDQMLLQALSLAHSYPDDQTPEQVVARATTYAAFLRGEIAGSIQ